MSKKVSITGVNTNNLPKLTNDEMQKLMKKVKQGDELAREQFVVSNLRLVLSVVHRFAGRKEKADDMFQVGCVGLMKAIDNFNTELGVRFSTYAVPMIIGEIRRFLRDNNSVRVSRSIRDTAYQSLQAKQKLTQELDREPTIDEIANEIGLDTFSVSNALDAISDTISLNQPVYKDGNETVRIMDQISDTKSHEDFLEEISLKDALVKLTMREKEILTLRYFIGKTQMEVSNEVGISQAQVSRLEKNALSSIKKLIN
jgi:RNA polymerase sporulation-specific sigma factor